MVASILGIYVHVSQLGMIPIMQRKIANDKSVDIFYDKTIYNSLAASPLFFAILLLFDLNIAYLPFFFISSVALSVLNMDMTRYIVSKSYSKQVLLSIYSMLVILLFTVAFTKINYNGYSRILGTSVVFIYALYRIKFTHLCDLLVFYKKYFFIGLSVMLNSLLIMLFMQMDRFIISKYIDYEAVGEYSVIAQFSGIIVIIAAVMSKFLSPKIFCLKHKRELILFLKTEYTKYMFISFGIMLIIILLPFLFNIEAIYGGGLVINRSVYVILSVSLFLYSLILPLNNIAHAFKFSRVLFIISGFSLFLNTTVSILIVPSLGVIGVSIGTLLACLVYYLLSLVNTYYVLEKI